MAINSVIRAAGGVLVRSQPAGGLEVAIVHRPAYDDWTFPKGKLQAGEREEHAALREVEEETGMRCRIERALGTTKYHDHRDRPKVVHYWLMRALDGHFQPTKEVDQLDWLPVNSAVDTLSYDHDRVLLRGLDELTTAGSTTARSRRGRATLRAKMTGAVYLLRHAKAENRSEWKGDDDLRPLSKRGRRQADELVGRLAAFSIERVISSSSIRCKQTVEPLCQARGLKLETSTSLAEGTDTDEVLDFVATCRDKPTVLCSHGDIVGDVITFLVREGLALESDLRWEKGSTWVLEHDGETFLYGRYLPAP
jgi:8-oxo-dGTP diphosphatase